MGLYFIDQGNPLDTGVLFLHGLGADSESWLLQIPSLVSAGYRAIAPDLPGFGRSRFIGKRWDLSFVTGELINFLRELGVPSVHLVGISMGGAIAIRLAAVAPDKIRSLVLVNSFDRLKPKNPDGWLYFIRRGMRAFFTSPQKQADLVANRIFPGADKEMYRQILIHNIRQSDPVVYRKAMVALATFNGQSYLGKICKPTLVITGQEDTTIPLSAQARLAQKIPHARHVVLPGAGHAANVDQPEVFNNTLVDFIRAQDESICSNVASEVTGWRQ